ncbi:uroporphyrinogen-III synthase [Oceanicoccus sagamiensis]|uniref:Uroporphyrinogen-III synthase n=1 Tax=Oceanicoccus sagamiensis TaxID=716816 RepID=A0A1X9NCK3_9GAMM|nr:uroporphyrinogen-III synthase [Oceanicoccus sagamiensis]ARN74152.1 hypothetical protein BST96_08480 [Oceanicoccus sagamiensis]
MSLQPLSVLVTRPQGQAAPLMAAIEHAGGDVWHYAVMAIAELTTDEQRQQCKQTIMALDEYQHIIFISGNAVHFGMEWINHYWPQLPLGINWYGIGKKTVAQLIEQGVPCVDSGSSGAMNSEALLQHNNLQQLAQQKVLIVRGVGGRDYLAEQLSQRGAKVSYAECYKRLLPALPKGELTAMIAHNAVNTVCLNSGESVNNFYQLLGDDRAPWLDQLTIVVPGDRVSAIASELGFAQVVTAENASDESMLEALKRL